MNNSEKGDFYFGISDNKIYICFDDVPAEMWGWNGRTFG